ncbi:unnamed protein product [Linum tenue]|uniref:Cyclin-dependent kinase inhibitor domain-containing protein n=1 Tax=Linum tenue TaxID=586396 RepID=A0AAV0RHW7_9ROSI|nr:unnamed protein product [Linum tenue]
MEDSSSRNCKRSDGGGFDEGAWDSARSFSKKLKKSDEDDRLEFAGLRSSSPLSRNSDEIRRLRCASAEGKAAAPTTSASNSSSAAGGRLMFDGDFCSAAADSRASTGGCCSSNVESSEQDVKESEFGAADLEAKSYETESSSTCIYNKFSREASPSSRFSADSSVETDMADDSSAKSETTTTEKPKTIPTATKRAPPSSTAPAGKAKESPSQEEIDEFFTAAENEQQKRFTEKYNFDVVKDAPLEGRYQWFRLKP